jgi:hypothetical protein
MTSVAAYANKIEVELGESWLPTIYRERILKMRTRAYEFPSVPKNPKPQIHHTLLGIELKIGRRRMLCPDLATARYLAVFLCIGVRTVAIPYDITKISRLADALESSWHRMLLLADSFTNDQTPAFRTRVRSRLIGKVREEIAAAGGGPRMPEFRIRSHPRRRRNRD